MGPNTNIKTKAKHGPKHTGKGSSLMSMISGPKMDKTYRTCNYLPCALVKKMLRVQCKHKHLCEAHL